MINLHFNSPEEEVHHPLFLEKNVQVYLKRDDLIHPFISGNKWRKLKYLLQQAEAEQKKHLVTFGGAWSNHLLATACAAAKFGFKSTAFVRGEDINTEVLNLCRMFGMNLLFTDRESYRDKFSLFSSHFHQDANAFFIDEGGCSAEAALGCEEILDELSNSYSDIFCASGTGTTVAGLINGTKNRNLKAKIHAIPVLKGDFLKREIEKLLIKSSPFEFHSDYHFGGYAKTPPELINFIQKFASTTGILLDPIYTGKMIFALFDLIEKNQFESGSRILAIHTGGLIGLFGKLKH